MHGRILLAVVLPSCAAPSADTARLGAIETRLSELQRTVGRIERAQSASSSATVSATCRDTFDTAFPDKTPLTEPVPFAVTETTLTNGNAIVIDEVRGTSQHFEVGGAYVVRGHYTLATADQARLALSTRTHVVGNCSRGSPRQATTAYRGTSSFELAYRIPFEGDVGLYLAAGASTRGGIVIGRTAPP